MLESNSYNLTLAYEEIAKLEAYLETIDSGLENVTRGAEFSASAHGVTIYFNRAEKREFVWDLVLSLTDDVD